MTKTKAPVLPSSGGSYVRKGEKLDRKAQTKDPSEVTAQPEPDATDTEES